MDVWRVRQRGRRRVLRRVHLGVRGAWHTDVMDDTQVSPHPQRDDLIVYGMESVCMYYMHTETVPTAGGGAAGC
jgi:hypothetical protein